MDLLQLQLGGVLDGDDALDPCGMNEESTLSKVVLPLLVPPETRMFNPARTAAFQEDHRRLGQRAEAAAGRPR